MKNKWVLPGTVTITDHKPQTNTWHSEAETMQTDSHMTTTKEKQTAASSPAR